ncbi:MAG: right-handed parallel beta-helix repeat-containing protein [candidate division Zixibacteria bacterium]|nr:right-handed parallel beta-helix repeat-containing protein [candidate division Zixibacteria bacterium]
MEKNLLFVLLFQFFFFNFAFSDTHYVSKTGSDTYPYTSWAAAADSIQKGINAASAGDTVRVGAGTYRELVMMIPGIVLLGAGMDSCLIYPYANSGRDIVYGQDSSVIEGFHIKGWSPDDKFCDGIYNSVDSKLKRIRNNKISQCDLGIGLGGVNTEVSNNIIENNPVGISSAFGDKSLIINNTFTNNHTAIDLWVSAGPTVIKNLIIAGPEDTHGIDGDFTDSTFIENNLIIGPEWHAVSLEKFTGQFEKAPIRNNTLISDGIYGVILISSFSNEIKNNIIAEGVYGIATYRDNGFAPNPQVSYNDLWNNTQNYYTEYGGSVDTSLGGNIYLDPMFGGGDDYHLQYGSPCIDAGDPNIKDPDSSRSDIGCYGGRWGETYTYQDYPPKAPDSLRATSSQSVITLHWKPNTESDLSHYLVYRDTLTGFIPDTFKIEGEVPKDSSVFRDADVVLGKSYYYRLSAWDLTGHQSEYSDEVQILATEVGESTEEENRPPVFRLFQNYPNPFNSSTVIWYHLPDVGFQPAEVEITIYNLLGRLVKTLVKERQYPGEHKVLWDGKDESGKEVASGIYFYRMKVSGLELVKPKKMVLLR